MSRTKHLIPIVLSTCLALAIPGGTMLFSQDGHDAFWKVVRSIQDIREGKNLEEATKCITKGSRLINGSRYGYLKDAATGDVSPCALSDSSYHAIAIEGRTNEAEDMGYIVLKTVKADTTKVRYHTVVFLRDSTGEFKISAWQVGGCN